MSYYNKQNTYSLFDSLVNPKDETEKKIPIYQSMLKKIYGDVPERNAYGTDAMSIEGVSNTSDTNNDEATNNPFLNENGEVFNDFIDYQKVLNNSKVGNKAKQFISEATGLSPTGGGYSSAAEESNYSLGESSSAGSYTGNSWTVNSSDGVFKNNQLMNIIKQVCAETGVPTNVLLAVAQQETGGKWYDRVADGTGYSYGYMMLYDNGVIADLKAKGKKDLAEKAKTDPYTNVLVGAQYLKMFYDQYGSWQQAAAKYNGSGTAAQNYGSKVWSRANTDAYLNAYKKPTSTKGTASTKGMLSSGGSTSSAGVVSATGNKIVDNAHKYMGTKYVWGGSSTAGMDCSGFVSVVLKDSGHNLGRLTAQGFRGYGQKVSKSDMQPGDVIFYGNSNNASHCGIYIGNGQMIHSSGGKSNNASNPGKGVSIQNVNYRSDFIEARRY